LAQRKAQSESDVTEWHIRERNKITIFDREKVETILTMCCIPTESTNEYLSAMQKQLDYFYTQMQLTHRNMF